MQFNKKDICSVTHLVANGEATKTYAKYMSLWEIIF